MHTSAIHELLRNTRVARGEPLEALAKRIGVREPLLRAIEAGEYKALPTGLYGRVAIRTYADALGFDGQAILAQCADLLKPLDDPIAGMARVRGIESNPFQWRIGGSKPADAAAAGAAEKPSAAARSPRPASRGHHAPRPSWRFIAAAAIDAGIVLGMLLSLVAITMTVFGAPVLSSGSGFAFGVVAVVLATCYFAVFGGIGGQTLGSRLAGLEPGVGSQAPIDLVGVGLRGFHCAARDVLVIQQIAAWLTSFSGSDRTSGTRHDTRQVELPAGS